jgi:hypothetical protein
MTKCLSDVTKCHSVITKSLLVVTKSLSDVTKASSVNPEGFTAIPFKPFAFSKASTVVPFKPWGLAESSNLNPESSTVNLERFALNPVPLFATIKSFRLTISPALSQLSLEVSAIPDSDQRHCPSELCAPSRTSWLKMFPRSPKRHPLSVTLTLALQGHTLRM